jgi:hypothetical protein
MPSKTLKILSIIGLVIAGLSLVCLVAFCNPYDYEAGIGWGMIAGLYLVAIAIVGLVKSRTKTK